MCELSLEEKIEIVHRCLILNHAHREVADAMRVKPSLISCLIKRTKDNKNFIHELRAKEDGKLERINKIVTEARTLLRQKQIIHKSSIVKHLVKDKHQLEVKNAFVCKVFREQLAMKFKPVKKIQFRGNSEQNLILR